MKSQRFSILCQIFKFHQTQVDDVYVHLLKTSTLFLYLMIFFFFFFLHKDIANAMIEVYTVHEVRSPETELKCHQYDKESNEPFYDYG